MQNKTLLTTKEVSSMLGVHINTIRTMTEDGRLKGVKTKGEQGHWRFHLSDVENFMNSNTSSGIDSILGEITYILDEIPPLLLDTGMKSNTNLWEYINKYYGIRSVFGSYAIHADMEKYRDIIDRKGFVWLGEGSANFMDTLNKQTNKSKFHNDKFANMDTEFAFGVVKSPSIFGEFSYSLVPLLVVRDNQEKTWIIDGTLQQFYPNLEKGLAVLPLEKAKDLYIGLQIYNKKEFAELYSDPSISEKFIGMAKELEKDSFSTD